MAPFSSIARTPTLLQMEAVECGAASLGIIMRYYGLYLPLEELRQECGVNRDGSNAVNILKAARRHHMEAKGYQCPVKELAGHGFPLIIHWNFNHFVVLEGFHRGKAYLNDPAVGHRTVPMDEFSAAFTGIVIRIRPAEGFRKGGKRFSIVGAVAKKLLTEKLALAFILIAGLMLVVPRLMFPVLNQVFVDDILSGKHRGWLFDFLLLMALVCVLLGCLTALSRWCLTRWQAKFTLRDSGVFFWHILRLPINFFQQRFSGEIAIRVGFNEKVANVLTGEAATAALDMLIAVFFLLLLLQYSWRLTLIGVGFTVLNILLFQMVRKRLLELALRVQQDAGMAMSVAINGLQAIETLKANGNENDFFSKWAGHQAKYLKGTQEIELTSQFLVVGPLFLNAANVAVIMLFGGLEIMDGIMTAGVFMAFRGLMDQFQQPLDRMMGLGQTLQTTEMQMQRLGDVLNYPVDSANYPAEPPAEIGVDKLSGRVEARGITFGYSPLAAPLIENFNLHIEPGRWVALVGGSGSGKSTLSRVVSGLYQEWEGTVLLDGLPRQEIPKEVKVNSIACVSQDISTFSGTIRENLSLFDAATPEADIQRAAADACIADDISRLAGGYDHLMAEGGANFSGGQRQRLELARALAVNPSLLILDEATSALDPVTEERILRNIRRRGCSCLMVAHRLSAFRDCDEIIVLENGKPVQRGTHSEMMRTDGPYRKLVAE